MLVLIDGVPYTQPGQGRAERSHPAYEDFPIEQVKRIEVWKAGSPLYGQNAFQGVVNIITEDAGSAGAASAYRAAPATGQFRASLGGKHDDLAPP